MKRSTLKWIGITAATTVLACGCAARAPQRSPAPGTAPGTAIGSTTGDADACAVALGNTPEPGYYGAGGAPGMRGGTAPGTVGGAGGTTTGAGAAGRTEVTANGIIIGNVALVALPLQDDKPLSPTTGATGTTGVSPTPGAPATGVGGAANAPRAVAPPAGGGGTTAIDRIRAACPKVVEIRVLNAPADRVRIGEIAMSVRRGQPATNFMDDIVRLNRAATVVSGNPRASGAPGPAGVPAAPGPGVAPAPGTTTPGTTAPLGTPTIPGTTAPGTPAPGGAISPLTPGTAVPTPTR